MKDDVFYPEDFLQCKKVVDGAGRQYCKIGARIASHCVFVRQSAGRG